MTRALRNAWLVFRHCWTHRHAWRITVEAKAEYPITADAALDWEWQMAQHAAGQPHETGNE